MRALQVAIWLAIIAAVISAGLVQLEPFVLAVEIAGKWGALLSVGAVFALIGSIGPKARVTPVLGPVVAGTIAMVVFGVLSVSGRLAGG